MITAKTNRRTIRAVKNWLKSGRKYDTPEYAKMSFYVVENSDRYARRIENVSTSRTL